MHKTENQDSTTNYVRRTTCCSGMTLVETVVWVAITLAAMLAIVSSVQYFYRTNNYTVEQSAAVSSAQRGIESMVKTIREAAYSSNGAYPIIAISTSSVAFYADIDSDPFIERLRFFVDGTSLKRGMIDPTGDPPVYSSTEVISTISDSVRNIEQGVPAFRYYDVNGNLMTNLTDISALRFIETTVVVNINPARMPNQFTLRSTAALRNLR